MSWEEKRKTLPPEFWGYYAMRVQGDSAPPEEETYNEWLAEKERERQAEHQAWLDAHSVLASPEKQPEVEPRAWRDAKEVNGGTAVPEGQQPSHTAPQGGMSAQDRSDLAVNLLGAVASRFPGGALLPIMYELNKYGKHPGGINDFGQYYEVNENSQDKVDPARQRADQIWGTLGLVGNIGGLPRNFSKMTPILRKEITDSLNALSTTYELVKHAGYPYGISDFGEYYGPDGSREKAYKGDLAKLAFNEL